MKNRYLGNFVFHKGECLSGKSHSDDVSYIFKFFPNSSLETESDAAMVEYMTSVIGRFIKTGYEDESLKLA